MYVIGIVGWKNAGKTTLLTRLLSALATQGVSVSTIKHTHHAVDLDQPGKDSFRHRAAGAQEVMLVSDARMALLREWRGMPQPKLDDLLARLAPVDIVLIEGFKSWPHDKIEIHRTASGGDVIARSDPTVKALVTDRTFDRLDVPQFDLDDVEPLARFVLRRAGLPTEG